MKLTKAAIDKLPVPGSGYALYRDAELPGFGVRVTHAGVKSFFLEKRIHRKVKRLTIGRYDVLTAEQARREAVKLLGRIASGGDPVADKAQAELESITLAEAFESYLQTRSTLKPLTVRDMRQAMKGFQDWLKKPLLSISRDMVAKRHRQLGEASQARANLAMRYLRAIFNFAMAEHTDAKGKPLLTDNPVKKLSQTRAWYRVERRQTVIKPHQLKPWLQAVLSLDNTCARDYFLLVLLTGLRRNEALNLRWDNVDLMGRTLTVKDTKNYQDHTLPLSDHLLELLEARQREAVGEYVFEGPRGRLSNLHYALSHVTGNSGVTFTIHDLRRTFAT
nr:integrase arm-type DNA-binding domain-containing protein [Pseudomonadota bacterium]